MDYFSRETGRIIYTDHSPQNFWTASKKIFNYNEFGSDQKCFGDKNHHRYLLDYMNQFIKNYQGHNKFGYIHLSTNHEETGLVIKTLDDDLKEMLIRFFKIHNNSTEDFVIMILGDHGKSFGNETVEGIIELDLPVHIMITSGNLMKKLGKDTHEILLHNTKRLVSRPD